MYVYDTGIMCVGRQSSMIFILIHKTTNGYFDIRNSHVAFRKEFRILLGVHKHTHTYLWALAGINLHTEIGIRHDNHNFGDFISRENRLPEKRRNIFALKFNFNKSSISRMNKQTNIRILNIVSSQWPDIQHA